MTPPRTNLVKKLVPLAQSLLALRASEGATTADLLEHAYGSGALTGNETHRELSGLGHVFRNAGGMNSGRTRCSDIPGQKSVRQVVWVLKPARPVRPSFAATRH